MPGFSAKRVFLLIVLVAVALTVVLTVDFWNYTQDDVFITYTYSRNIAQGQGFVFNPSERVQGTTTPLYSLLMAGVYLVIPDLLHAGNVLSAVLLLFTCGLAVNLVQEELSVYSRLAIAITLVTSPLVYVSFGMETLLYCAFLMLAFWLWGQGHRRGAMLIAAALTWTRADGVVLGGTLWLVAAWERWQGSTGEHWLMRVRKLPWILGVIYAVGIAPWFGFAWMYFGTPLPNTLSAKQEIFQGLKFWADGIGWMQAFYGNNSLIWLAFPLIILGIWRAVLQPRLRPLALWAILFTAGYTALNVTAFWYYMPLVAVSVVLAAVGGEWLACLLLRHHLNRLAVIGASLAIVIVSGIMAILSVWPYGTPPPRVDTYRLIGQWIDQNTEPDSTILVGDLGIMGYYARRRTLDTPGLIVPKLPHWQDGYTIAKYRPEYVVATQYYAWGDLVAQDWFTHQYIPAAQISTPDDIMSPITLYRRRMSLTVPKQIVQGFDLPLTCPIDLDEGEALPETTQARLLSPTGEMLVETSQPSLWRQYPDERATQAEEILEQIALPLTVSPGSYTWEVDCSKILQGTVEILPAEQSDGYVAVSDAKWDDFAQLKGVALPQGDGTWSGGTLDIMLNWETIDTPSLDYSLFVHLRDADGQVAAQADGYPRNGSRPTTTWSAGETIIDVWHVALPPTLSEGDYELWVGWYDWRTGERLLLSNKADAIELPVGVHNKWPGGSGLP